MSKPSNDELFLMQQLREVLLKEDRSELEKLREVIDDPELLSDRIMPIIEGRIDFLRKNFPKEYRSVIDGIIERKLKSSQAELIDTLYPLIGQMIKKYINHQFQMMKDSIDHSIRETLNAKNIWWRIKTSIFGMKDSESLIRNLDTPQIEEIYLIQRDSGLLMGSASLSSAIDKDVIAGMLTAIKAFVEDAFQRDNEELEMIQYGTYKILLYNFHSYYVSVAMSGSISTAEKDRISDELNDFAINELKDYKHHELDQTYALISQKLEDYFIAPQRQGILRINDNNAVVPKNQAIIAYD
jgi:hypothetical protein